MPSMIGIDNTATERSMQCAWPMVENAMPQPEAIRWPSSEIDEQAYRLEAGVEARTGLPRTANGGPAHSDREMARALVDAGYMPLADYIALYGDDVATHQEVQAATERPMRVSGHFPMAFPRRQSYRATSVRCSFAKPPPRSGRAERRA